MRMLRNQGIVLGQDGEKMSKSRGNVVDPDQLVKMYGADTIRAYLMFFARWELGAPWNSSGIEGTARWIRRTWSTILEPADVEISATEETIRELRRKVHQTLQAVTRDFDSFSFNTIISGLMELLNKMIKAKQSGAFGTPAWTEAVEIYLKMMAPIAPHIAEELWSILGNSGSIHIQAWPTLDAEAAKEDEITLIVQVNGKLRDRISLPASHSEDDARKAALVSANVRSALAGKEAKKIIVVPGKLVNIVA